MEIDLEKKLVLNIVLSLISLGLGLGLGTVLGQSLYPFYLKLLNFFYHETDLHGTFQKYVFSKVEILLPLYIVLHKQRSGRWEG